MDKQKTAKLLKWLEAVNSPPFSTHNKTRRPLNIKEKSFILCLLIFSSCAPSVSNSDKSKSSSFLNNTKAIITGYDHTCALNNAGYVKCWGSEEYGRLGNGETDDISIPVNVHTSSTDSSPLGGIIEVASGAHHSCVLTKQGRVKCWGHGRSGLLGDGTTADKPTPVDVHNSATDTSPLSGITQISSIWVHTCALTDGGNVKCWGSSLDGQLGDGTTHNSSTPVNVHTSSTNSSPLGGIAAVSAGGNHTCALTNGGNVKCWGYGIEGQLGNGRKDNIPTPVNVRTSSTNSSPLGNITAVSAGGNHTCALTKGGNVKCWGNGRTGQLGNRSTDISSTPVNVHTSSTNSSPLDNIAAISSGNNHTCALTERGHVKCWGLGSEGELGVGKVSYRPTPVSIYINLEDSNLLGDIAAVSTGNKYTCVLTITKNVKCWGEGNSGQLGSGTTTDSLIPVSVDL